MKKLFILLTTVLIASTLISCASTKSVSEEGTADSYESEPAMEKVSKEKNENDSNLVAVKSKRNGFAQFFLGKEKYAYGDKFTVFQKNNLTGNLGETEVLNAIALQEGTAGFCSYYMTTFYYVFFNASNRDKLEKAYKTYLSDFENRRLIRKTSKTRAIYGNIAVTLNWGTVKASAPNHGTQKKAQMGYMFYKNSPYFIITIPPVYNEYRTTTSAAAQGSIPLTYAFTKNQLKNLLDHISDDAINQVIIDFNGEDMYEYENYENVTETTPDISDNETDTASEGTVAEAESLQNPAEAELTTSENLQNPAEAEPAASIENTLEETSVSEDSFNQQ